LISNPGNDDAPLQLPSVHHNPLLWRMCTWCWREER